MPPVALTEAQVVVLYFFRIDTVSWLYQGNEILTEFEENCEVLFD